MTDNGTDTRLVDIKGRTVVIKQLKDGQLLLLGRDQRKLEDPQITDAEKMSTAIGVLDMFEASIVQPSDREYVMGLTRTGDLELKDFLSFLTAFQDPEATVEPVKPVVRRGRPRKSVK